MIETVLSVDIGTTSLKTALITAEGDVVSFCKVALSAPENRFVAEGWIWALRDAVGKLKKSANAASDEVVIKAMAVSGHGPTLVSESGLTFRWNEFAGNRTFDSEEVAKSLFLPRILAFRDLFPGEFEASEYLYSGPEYLIYKLTSQSVTILPEERYISAYWSDATLEMAKISNAKLPPYVKIGEQCGVLTSEAMEFLDLPESIPVIAGGPDFIVALIGTDTLAPGKICDRSGSSEGINLCTAEPLIAEGIRTLPSVVPGLWNASVLMPNSSTLPEEERLNQIETALNKLKQLCTEKGLAFADEITVTGGQLNDEAYMQKKAEKIKLKLIYPKCNDAELLGDAKVAWNFLQTK
ncbi:MAG: hypothetical protein MJ188_11065 [Treponema sp.]|nr:hypothetical protein [Treponema sp.]